MNTEFIHPALFPPLLDDPFASDNLRPSQSGFPSIPIPRLPPSGARKKWPRPEKPDKPVQP